MVRGELLHRNGEGNSLSGVQPRESCVLTVVILGRSLGAAQNTAGAGFGKRLLCPRAISSRRYSPNARPRYRHTSMRTEGYNGRLPKSRRHLSPTTLVRSGISVPATSSPRLSISASPSFLPSPHPRLSLHPRSRLHRPPPSSLPIPHPPATSPAQPCPTPLSTPDHGETNCMNTIPACT